MNTLEKNPPARPAAVFYGLLVLFLGGLIAACWRRIDQSEILFHLRIGQVILKTEQIPNQDIFSATSSVGMWHNFSWLWGQMLAWLYQAKEWQAIATATVTVTGLSVTLGVMRCRARGADWYSSLIVNALIFIALLPLLQLTPYVGSLLLFTVSLLLGEPRFRRWQLLVYPALASLWVNVHPSALLVLLVPISRFIFPDNPADTKRLPLSRFFLAVIIVTSVLGLLVNPGSVRVIPAWTDLFNTQLASASDNIRQFATSPSLIFQALLAVAFLIIIAVRNPLMKYQYIPVGVLLVSSVLLSPYCIAYLLLYLAPSASLALGTLLQATWQRRGVVRHLAATALLFVCIAALSVTLLVNRITPDAFGTGIRKGVFPETAAGRLSGLPNRATLLNDSADAYYLLWRLWPTWKVSIDDRPGFYDAEFRNKHDQLWQGPEQWNELLTSWRVNAIVGRPDRITGYPVSNLYDKLANAPDWKAVYWDSHSIVYLRSEMDVSASNFEPYRFLKPGITWEAQMKRVTTPDQLRELTADLRRAVVDDPDNAVAQEFLRRAEAELN